MEKFLRILYNLTAADTQTVKQAEMELEEAFKNPESITALYELMNLAPEVHIRQYAAVLLTKRFTEVSNWNALDSGIQQHIKINVMEKILKETDSCVRHAKVQLLGIIMVHDVEATNEWTTITLGFILNLIKSPDPQQSLVGSEVFSKLADTAMKPFVANVEQMYAFFNTALMIASATGNIPTSIILNIIDGMKSLLPAAINCCYGVQQIYEAAVPFVIKALETFAMQADVRSYYRAMEYIDQLLNFFPKFLNSNFSELVRFCVCIMEAEHVVEDIRIRTTAFIGFLMRNKKQRIVQDQLLESILLAIFKLIAVKPLDEDNDEYFLANDKATLASTAAQTLDIIALHLPSEKMLPQVLTLIQPALPHEDPIQRRAAYLMIAIISEGCSDEICEKYLAMFMEIIRMGINDSVVMVHNAALFALGQFSDYMDPDIRRFAGNILPLLVQKLEELNANTVTCGGRVNIKNVDRLFTALESFLENLNESDVLPYLQALMQGVLPSLAIGKPHQAQNLCMCVVISLAACVGTHIMPWFEQLFDLLRPYLVTSADDTVIILSPQAIETLSALIKAVGKDNFMPLSKATMEFALAMLEETDDPDLRQAVYLLISSLSAILEDEIEAELPKFIEQIFKTLSAMGGVVRNYTDPNDTGIVIDPVDESELEDNVSGASDGEEVEPRYLDKAAIENAFVDEKQRAIYALQQFAIHSPKAMLPYLYDAFQKVLVLTVHPHEDVRKEAIIALGTFTLLLSKQENKQSLALACGTVVPKLHAVIKCDHDKTVVVVALETLQLLLNHLKALALPSNFTKERSIDCIQAVLMFRINCLARFNDDSFELEDSEYDVTVIDSAANLLPLIGYAVSPAEFAIYFERIKGVLLSKLHRDDTSANATAVDTFKHHAVFYGVLAECFESLKENCSLHFDTLLPVFLNGLTVSQGMGARENAIFGIGELILFSKDKSFEQLPKITEILLNTIIVECNNPTVCDAVCGALARIILTNYKLIPLENVVPVFMAHLPLQINFQDNIYILKSLNLLYKQQRNYVLPFIDDVAKVANAAIPEAIKMSHIEAIGIILELLQDILENYNAEFRAVFDGNVEMFNNFQILQNFYNQTISTTQ